MCRRGRSKKKGGAKREWRQETEGGWKRVESASVGDIGVVESSAEHFFYRWPQQFPQERDQGGERERGTVERKRVREGEDRIESKEEVPGRERRVDVRARLIKSNLIKISVLTL